MSPSGGYRPPAWWRRLLGWNAVGVVVVVVAVGISLSRVWSVRQSYYSGDRTIVRITHWQLEAGYREALQHIIDGYNRMMDERHRRGEIPRPVEVVQVPVTERVFAQIVNTNLLARSAPDIIQLGMSNRTQGPQKAQFFLSLDEFIREPNPYNDAAQLEAAGVDKDLARALRALPWRDTALDGMRSGFDKDLQAFYGVPASFCSSGRLSYNADLLKAATGSDRPPRTLGELLDACAKLKSYAERTGQDIVPIAGTKQAAGFFSAYYLPFFSPYRNRLDLDCDGSVSEMEGWAGFGSGVFNLTDRPFVELTEAAAAISSNFPQGFLALGRDTATYLFVQGRAAMHITGSWDAGTLYRLSQGRFRMGTTDFPLPAPGEPWGDPVKHPVTEAGDVGSVSFGVYKFGQVDEAVDFLRYLTSHQQNQRFNREADWIPVVMGTRPDERMAPYAPRIEGLQRGSAWAPGERQGKQVSSTYNGQMLSLISGQADAAGLAERVREAYDDPAIGEPVIWADEYDAEKAYLRALDRTLGVQSAVSLLGGGDRAEAGRRYRTLLGTQAGRHNGEYLRLLWSRTVGAATGRPFPESR